MTNGTTGLRQQFVDLPKAHLHVHLEAAMRESTLRQWCAEDGVAVPPLVEYPDFTRFLDAYDTLLRLLRTPERVERLLDEVVRSEEHTSELQSRGHLVC